MKVNGMKLQTREMDVDIRFGQMVLSMKVIGKTTKRTVEAD